jgi:DNA-binding transcriptional regulator YiaG
LDCGEASVTIARVRPAEVFKIAEVRRLVETGEAERIRVDSHLSVHLIAAAARTADVTIWRYEHGERRPSGQVALRYLDVLKRLADSK